MLFSSSYLCLRFLFLKNLLICCYITFKHHFTLIESLNITLWRLHLGSLFKTRFQLSSLASLCLLLPCIGFFSVACVFLSVAFVELWTPNHGVHISLCRSSTFHTQSHVQWILRIVFSWGSYLHILCFYFNNHLPNVDYSDLLCSRFLQ